MSGEMPTTKACGLSLPAHSRTGCRGRHCISKLWQKFCHKSPHFLMLLLRHQTSFHPIHSCSAPRPERYSPLPSKLAQIVQLIRCSRRPATAKWLNFATWRVSKVVFPPYFFITLLFGHSLAEFTKCSGRWLGDDKWLHSMKKSENRVEGRDINRDRSGEWLDVRSSFWLSFLAHC